MQATSVAPAALADSLGRFIAHLNASASPALFRVLGDVGISLTQLKVLFVLGDRGDATVGELAEELALSLPAMSRAIDGLVQGSYVRRAACEHDRRARSVVALPAAERLLARVHAARSTELQRFAAELPAQQRDALHAALAPICERLP